ncbi:MAG: Abi family protein [Vicinamibacterales bacterium]
MQFGKPPLSYADQANLLIARGLTVGDRDVLLHQLAAVGYYRLCAYWYPFKQADEAFVPGTSFETIWDRYVFDRQLRLLVMDAIERVEVAVRTALVHELAMTHGPFAQTDIANFASGSRTRHKRLLDDLHAEANRSREVFVQHFKVRYDEFPDLPIWVAAETMTFGGLVTMFSISHKRTQKHVAQTFGLTAPVLESWLLTLNYIRNICAHHARLWNRELAIKPVIPDVRNRPEWHGPHPVSNHRIYGVLSLLQFLLRRIAPQSAWRVRLYAHVDRHPLVPLPDMGADATWRAHDVWR